MNAKEKDNKSILYPDPNDVKTFIELTQNEDEVTISFSCNGGKFGTMEGLADYTLKVDRLMQLLDGIEATPSEWKPGDRQSLICADCLSDGMYQVLVDENNCLSCTQKLVR